MNKTLASAAITAALGTIIILMVHINHSSLVGLDRVMALAFTMVGLTLVIGVAALIAGLMKKTRDYVQGIWLGGGIVLLIGFGVCTLV